MNATSFKYDILRDCALLEKEKTFANLYDLICAHGDVEAAMWLDGTEVKSLTFNELAAQADAWAVLLGKTFGTEGRVCISLDSCKEWFPLFWGLVRSGHDVMAVDASASDEKLADLMTQANCFKLVSSKRHNLGSEFQQSLVTDFVDAPAAEGYIPVWGKDIALCTSGTTSGSRIFVYDEETICYLALFSAKVHDENYLLIDDECFRTLAFLPFHHILGFAAIFIWSHFLGDTTVYLKDRSAETIVRTSKLCKVSQIVSVPLLAGNISKTLHAKVSKGGIIARLIFGLMTGFSLAVQWISPEAGLKLAGKMFRGIQKQILGPDIKSIVLGGSHADAKSLRTLNAIGYFTICGYGMTETAITGFETSFRLSNRIKGSVGAPMAYTQYRIKDGANVGELQVKGPGIHDARFVDGQLLPPDVDAEGWFSTGDIVRINKEKQQYFIDGRIKEVIINESGENVYPDELEDVFSSLAGVSQFTILGVAKKNTAYEDITLVCAIGDKFDDKAFIDNLGRQIRKKNAVLPVYTRLTRVLVTPEQLPVANGVKVKRLALRKMIEDGELTFNEIDLSAKNDAAIPAKRRAAQRVPADIVKKVKQIYAQVLNRQAWKIDPEKSFVEDYGGDSLQVLSVATKMEETFGIIIPDEYYSRLVTVNGAAAVVDELQKGASAGRKLVLRNPITTFEDTPEFKNFKVRHDSLMAQGEDNPYFVNHDSPLLDTSIINGKEVLDFGSYNYAGMSGRPEVSAAAKKAIDMFGTSASGSRLLAGERPVHGELEREIAAWKHAESALVCVGGHSTNVTIVGNFCGPNDLIIYDALAHNSIEQGCKLSEAVSKSFPHNDAAALDNILSAQRKYFEKVLIVIEGVYSMDGDIADVPAFVEIKKKYGCFLMVDEAHSACVLGETGGGVDEYFHLNPDDIDIKMGTMSKGLGTCGGYIAGKASLVEYLRYNLPGFVFSVGVSPALAAGSLEAIRQLRTNPTILENLRRNIECFATEARKRHLDICLAGKSAVLPVMVGRDEDAFALSNEMTRRGVFVPPAVFPAVPKNKARLRYDVISEHKPEQIVKALDILEQTARDLGIELPRRNYE